MLEDFEFQPERVEDKPKTINYTAIVYKGKKEGETERERDEGETKIYLTYDLESDTLTIRADKIKFETNEFTVDKPKK